MTQVFILSFDEELSEWDERELRNFAERCADCYSSEKGGIHFTLEECNRILAEDGRECEHPGEHHPYRARGTILPPE